MLDTWKAVEEDRLLEAMLLPARRPLGASWFASPRDHSRPTVEGCLEAQARFAAALVRNEKVRPSSAGSIPWRMIFFESEFRDPREFADAREHPETPGWQRVRALEPSAYDAFLDSLLGEDVSLFFSSVEMDPERKAFWKQYVGAASSSMFFLSPPTLARLEKQFSGADAGVRSVLRRARRLRDGRVDAFALKFGRSVIVEFSETGNALYLYESRVFDEFSNARLRIPDLKRKDLGGRAFNHSKNWTTNLKLELRHYGIQPRRGS